MEKTVSLSVKSDALMKELVKKVKFTNVMISSQIDCKEEDSTEIQKATESSIDARLKEIKESMRALLETYFAFEIDADDNDKLLTNIIEQLFCVEIPADKFLTNLLKTINPASLKKRKVLE